MVGEEIEVEGLTVAIIINQSSQLRLIHVTRRDVKRIVTARKEMETNTALTMLSRGPTFSSGLTPGYIGVMKMGIVVFAKNRKKIQDLDECESM